MMRRAALLITVMVTACGGDETRQIRLELGLRTSCPAATRSYDIGCVNSLVVGLVGADGQRFKSQCTPVTESYPSMQDLIASTRVIEVLKEVRARSDVRLELRAYHAVGDQAACTSLDDSALLFWGMSPIVDLSDSSLGEVLVELECRPECDCADLVATRCPAELVDAICAPPENRQCRKECESAENCYGGLLSCEVGVCEGGGASATKCCAPVAARTCAPCTNDENCESGVCVHKLANPEKNVKEEWFCADLCPPLPDVTPCPTGMACKRLNNGIYVRAGAGTP